MLPKFEEEARVWHQTIFQVARLVDVTKSCNDDLVDVDGIFYESLITEMVAPAHHSNSMLLEMGFVFNANWNFDGVMQNIS